MVSFSLLQIYIEAKEKKNALLSLLSLRRSECGSPGWCLSRNSTVFGTMADLTEENNILLTERLPKTNCCSNQYVVNIVNNYGTVINGDNTVINSSAPNSASLLPFRNERMSQSDENSATRSKSNHFVPCSRGRRSPATWEMKPSASNLQHRRDYERGKRKDVNKYGTVINGDNTVINSSAPNSASLVPFRNERIPQSDENFETRSPSNHFVPCSRGRQSAATWETKPSANNLQHRRDYKRGKRKDDNHVNEVSEFMRKKKNDRRRMKRQKRNSRQSSPSSDDDIRDSTFNELAALDSDGSGLQQGLQTFHSCSKLLHPLRDNGRWADFDRVAQELLDKAAGDLTCRIIICLEKSVALSYQKEIERSEDMINNAVTEIDKTSGSDRCLLEVLSNCYLAGLHRRKKEIGTTQHYLEIAGKFASGFPCCLPVAILLYEKGSFERDFAAQLLGSKKEPSITEAKRLMQSCVDLCHRLDHEQVYVGKEHFAVSKLAIINLHCETSTSRNETIDQSSIEEAGKYLDTLQTDSYSNTELQGAKIQRLKAKVDFYYRIDKFREAEKYAQEALEMAERLGFNLEKTPLNERLTDISRKIMETSSSETFRESPEIIDSSSGSLSSRNNSPNSSECEVEEKL